MQRASADVGVSPQSGREAEAQYSRVYTPDSPLRRPRQFVADVARDLRSARVLAWRLVVRDIAAQYRQTALGYLWAALPSLFNAVVWVILNSSNVVTIHTGGVPYAAYVFTGTFFWQLFLDALNAPLQQLNANRGMLIRVNFPTEALLASGIAQALFGFAVRLVILAVAFAIFRPPLAATVPAIVFPAFGILLIGTVLGVLIAPIGLLYKDVSQALPMIVMPLMFLTPVVYSAHAGGTVGTIMRFNPLTPMFEITREFLFGGAGPYVVESVVVSCVTLAIAVLGWLFYRLSLPVLVERFES